MAACSSRREPAAEPLAPAGPALVSIQRSDNPAGGAGGPVYDLTLREDGQVEYVGRAQVAVTGRRTRTVPQRTLARVREMVGPNAFADVPPDCCNGNVTGQTLKLTVGPPVSRSISILYKPHAEGIEGRISRLADDLAVIAGTRDLVGTRPGH